MSNLLPSFKGKYPTISFEFFWGITLRFSQPLDSLVIFSHVWQFPHSFAKKEQKRGGLFPHQRKYRQDLAVAQCLDMSVWPGSIMTKPRWSCHAGKRETTGAWQWGEIWGAKSTYCNCSITASHCSITSLLCITSSLFNWLLLLHEQPTA